MRRALPLAALAIALVALPGPAAAGADVVNGDFESGTLDGWQAHRAFGGGSWFAYRDGKTPISEKRGSPVPPPPQGRYAAIADELTTDTLVLYQDVTLGPGSSQQLSLLAYYESLAPIAVPASETLSVDEEALGGERNQQFRIDVMRPEAPLESVQPGDVLRTVFRTKPGDPRRLPPKRLTADLGPFAGQTVRIRIAVAAHEDLFNAGVDAVSIGGAGGPGSSGSARFRARARPRRGNGTVLLRVWVPGPGLLSARGKGVRPAVAKAAATGTVTLRLRLSPSRWAALQRRRRISRRVTVTYLPANEPREAASLPVVFKLPGPRRR